jgi:exodeoxyribonuclease VII large subunit
MGETPSALSLFELNNQVKSGMRELFPGNFWITGEISELNVNQSGHCYLELVEKKPETEQITARAKATIWAFTFRMLRPYFESVTGQRFSAGIKIMVQVSVEFHEVYGYSLNIKDIDPNFTLGDLSRKRQEIIQRLHDEGVFHLNKELNIPLVPQRIAVISSETAAGYGDFMDQLTKNRSGYQFTVHLFQAYMQGEGAEQSIINALERIFEAVDEYDLVIIIRGGGSQADLNCFNSYWLSYHITQFPLPVITGIGHERDETIADLVAHTNLKTPTAVAEFIINAVLEFDEYLNQLKNQVFSLSSDLLATWKDETGRLSRTIISLAKLRMSKEDHKIESFALMSRKSLKGYLQKNHQRLADVKDEVKHKLQHYFQYKKQHLSVNQKNIAFLLKSSLKEEKQHLATVENTLHLLDPVHILKRGYTLTYSQGKLIKSALHLKPGDQIESKWIDGTTVSTVEKLLKPYK